MEPGEHHRVNQGKLLNLNLDRVNIKIIFNSSYLMIMEFKADQPK